MYIDKSDKAGHATHMQESVREPRLYIKYKYCLKKSWEQMKEKSVCLSLI